MSFWRLFFTRKLKEEFGVLLYSFLRTVVLWEPVDTCKSNVWELCMHRWFVQIICHEVRVSWMSLTHYMCISKLVGNSAAYPRWPGTFRLTAQDLCGSLTIPLPWKSWRCIWIPIIFILSPISLLWYHLHVLFPPTTLCASIWFHFLIFALLAALCIWDSLSSQRDARRLMSVVGLPHFIQKRIRNRKKSKLK